MHYFRYDNASRAIKLGSKRFTFDVVGQVAGSWTGVLATDGHEDFVLLTTEGLRFGIAEISKEEYEAQLKKKVASSPSSRTSVQSRILIPLQGRPDAALVVKPGEVQPSPTKDISKAPVLVIQPDEVVNLGKAEYKDPLDEKPAAKPGKKAKK